MERFLCDDNPTIASIYAPIIFPPASVIVLSRDPSGKHRLVATGSVHDLNPARVVVKRIVLSGHPFKIQKRLAVVRYMFFNRGLTTITARNSGLFSEDIDWFKPIEFRTKSGRRGHIQEALANTVWMEIRWISPRTHGHMKCLFDGHLTSQDCVLMNLYKRVYPKWTYNSRVPIADEYLTLSKAPVDDQNEIVMMTR